MREGRNKESVYFYFKLTHQCLWKQQIRMQSIADRITKTTNVTPIAAPRLLTIPSLGTVGVVGLIFCSVVASDVVSILIFSVVFVSVLVSVVVAGTLVTMLVGWTVLLPIIENEPVADDGVTETVENVDAGIKSVIIIPDPMLSISLSVDVTFRPSVV